MIRHLILYDVKAPKIRRNVRSLVSIATVSDSEADVPNLSDPRRDREFGLRKTEQWRILQNIFCLHKHCDKIYPKFE